MITTSIKNIVKKNFLLSCLGYCYINCKINIKTALGIIGTDSGTTHRTLSTQHSLNYIQSVFDDYKHYGEVNKFKGLIAEVGPGDNVGVALLMLQDGAQRIDLADKFYSHRKGHHHKKIYQALFKNNPNLKKILTGGDLEDEETFKGIYRYYGKDAAAECFFNTSNHYDFIISRSVFEHLDDPILALEQMTQALKPGGKMLHKVDLRDHKMFSSYFHELKFYEIPDFMYALMTKGSGYPNRILLADYKKRLTQIPNIKIKFYITQLAGYGPIEPHVPFEKLPKTALKTAKNFVEEKKKNFSSSLKHRTTEDLMVTGFFMVIEKLKDQRKP